MADAELAVKFFASHLNSTSAIKITTLQGHQGQASKIINEYVNRYDTFYEFLKSHDKFFKINGDFISLKCNFKDDSTCSVVQLLTEKLKQVGFLLPENINDLKQDMTSDEKLKLGLGIEGILAFLTKHFLTFRIFRNSIIGLRSSIDQLIVNGFVTLLSKKSLKLASLSGYFSHFPSKQREWLGTSLVAIENYIKDNINVFNYKNNTISLKPILISVKQISPIKKTLSIPSSASGTLNTPKAKEINLTTCENIVSTSKKKRTKKKCLDLHHSATQISSPTKTVPTLVFRSSFCGNLKTSNKKETNLMAAENTASTVTQNQSYVGRISLLSPSYGFIKNGVDSKNVLFTIDVCYCSQKKVDNLFEFYKENDEVGFHAEVLTGNETYKYQATLVWKGKKPVFKIIHSPSYITSDHSSGSFITQKDSNKPSQSIKTELQTDKKNLTDQTSKVLEDNQLENFSLHNPFLVDNKFESFDVPKFSSNEQNCEVRTDFVKVKTKEVACQTVSTGEILSFKLVI